jgi:hypothetical protein
MIGKLLSPQEMIESPEEVFKFVRIHDTRYGWFWKFCHMDVDHTDMVEKDEVPLSAGFLFVVGKTLVDGKVLFPEEMNLPNFSTTLKLNASVKDLECIPILFGECSEGIDGKHITNEFRDANDSPVDGDEGEHGDNSS